jgi:hypothetical protein
LGKGDGTFAAKVDYATGEEPRSVAVGDLNRDGKLDLVTANHGAGTVSVLLGTGDGTFADKVDSPSVTGPYALALGDLNKDSKLDVVVVDFYYESSVVVSVMLGTGDGKLGAGTSYRVGNGPNAVALGDLDGNGSLDVVATATWFVGAGVLLGKGDGTFAETVGYETGRSPSGVAVGDLNGDGKLDIVTANETLSLLVGSGDGTLAPKVDYAAGVHALALGDLNGDGMLDVVAANAVTDTVSVLLGSCR